MRYFASGILLFFLLAITYSLVVGGEIKVRTSGGIEKIESAGDNDALLYSLSALSSLLGGKMEWEEIGYSVRFQLEASRFRFTAESPYVSLNGTIHNLIYPVKIIKGELYVPARTFTALLDDVRADKIEWDAGGKMIRIDPEWFNITDLAVSPKKNGLLVELFVSDQLAYEIYPSEGNWLNITFVGGKVNQPKIEAGLDKSLMTDLRAYQFDSSSQVSLQFRQDVRKFYHSYKTDPGRLQISIEDKSFNPDSVLTTTTRIGPDETVDVIVIDAGHGGDDFGAIGKNKRTREKDITLEVAKELARIIREDKSFRVVMTRTKDVYVSLEERARLANEARADLFISIHCNASPKAMANGFEIFYLAPAKNDTARAVAQLENAPFLVNDPGMAKNDQGDVAFILNDMIQTEFLTESADLAYMVDMELRERMEIKSRGVDHAGFVVLNRVYMPSVLVETAFISNPEEERLLRSKEFRNLSARSIYEAIRRFKAKYEKKR